MPKQEKPTAEAAAETPKEESKPDAPEPRVVGTSAQLFPELLQGDEPVVHDQPPIDTKPEAMVETKEEIKPKEQSLEDIFSVDTLRGKKVRVKVSGEEFDVDGADLIKSYQLESNLTKKYQKLADEKKAWEDERKKVAADKPKKPDPLSELPQDDSYVMKMRELEAEISVLKAEQEQTKQAWQTVAEETRPARYEAALRQIDKRMKAEGMEDFTKYVPRIEETLYALTDSEFARFNNESGFEMIYKDMKLKDMIKGQSVRTESPKVDERPKPKAVKVEGGSAPTLSDEESASYQKAFEEWKKNPNQVTFHKMMRQKFKGNEGVAELFGA